ncbi:MAG: M20/M25/M40 family metallo-hydrolase, partial [Planctomycetaceae bacterium]
MQRIHQYLQENGPRFEQDLCNFLRIPSVSADTRCRDAIGQAAEWLKDHLTALGLTAECIATDGCPLVFAQSPPVDGAPTVLVYGHYDVQPPEPLEQWTTPPFEPTIRDGSVYARGATDDK